MSELEYYQLKFDARVDEKPFSELINEINVKNSSYENFRLPPKHLRAFIAVIFTYGLHYDEVPQGKRELFMSAVLDNKQHFLNLSQTFVQHLIHNFDETTKAQLLALEKLEFNILEPLKNPSLLDFVEMNLMDQTTSYRKWEYGRFSIAYFLGEFSERIPLADSIKSLIEKNHSPKSIVDFFDEEFQNAHYDIDDHESKLLALIIKAKCQPKATTMADYILAGSIVQQNLLGLSLRLEKLTETIENAMKKSVSIGKRKGGPKL
ncbi:hypothetical protein [Maribacter sp. ACAM166]|uniref:hypothetical protein n=1 Tax=Maribacter sp. ACAM166 TaxID=2508996 RepID=UPI0010FCF023|nr:hypothetical protein [Maribacter sp. ACAM166]TLP81848.1 hypothetical protein ES765_03980 [Maribacter sp. ACAM166]